jgi:glycosyltransferase involved in cell wall biosynthesis
MVTLPVAGRLPYVKSSVGAYARQAYPNKELLVAINGGDADARAALVDYFDALKRPDIRVLQIDGDLTLGRLRNITLEQAHGEAICQWDDDDLHHPDRLSLQLQALLEGDYEAAYLQDVMQYVPADRSLYWTRWSATEAQYHPGTLMARRGAPILYETEGGQACLGEDLKVALALNARGKVRRIDGIAHLFVYTSHGANSWDDGHHKMLRDRLAISRGLLLRREAEIRDGLRPYRFDAYPVQVRGNNGVAFQIEADVVDEA